MSKLKPLPESAIAPFMDALMPIQEAMGFIPNSLKTMARVPELMKRFGALIGMILLERL